MKENVIQAKSYQFALRIVKLNRYIIEKHKEFVLSKQILKSGTSIGANVEEALGAQSKKDFISKLQIALKEARETHYWLRLLKDSEYITENEFNSIEPDCAELLKILKSIVLTSSGKPREN